MNALGEIMSFHSILDSTLSPPHSHKCAILVGDGAQDTRYPPSRLILSSIRNPIREAQQECEAI